MVSERGEQTVNSIYKTPISRRCLEPVKWQSNEELVRAGSNKEAIDYLVHDDVGTIKNKRRENGDLDGDLDDLDDELADDGCAFTAALCAPRRTAGRSSSTHWLSRRLFGRVLDREPLRRNSGELWPNSGELWPNSTHPGLVHEQGRSNVCTSRVSESRKERSSRTVL